MRWAQFVHYSTEQTVSACLELRVADLVLFVMRCHATKFLSSTQSCRRMSYDSARSSTAWFDMQQRCRYACLSLPRPLPKLPSQLLGMFPHTTLVRILPHIPRTNLLRSALRPFGTTTALYRYPGHHRVVPVLAHEQTFVFDAASRAKMSLTDSRQTAQYHLSHIKGHYSARQIRTVGRPRTARLLS